MDIIKLRRGTAAAWTSANPILALGEVGLETDTLKAKFGDGATAWSSLSYFVGAALDAELAAIAGLTSAADTLPYFTGSGTAALTAFTAAGRAIVDDADAAAQRATLGLGTIATQSAASVAITGGSITGLSSPSASSDAATKGYVDSLAAGLKWKSSVRAATTAAGTLATSFENGDAIDGVTLATGDRILIKDQLAGDENGIYTVNASGAPTRATDADSGAELVSAAVFVEQGTANADKAFVCTNNSITLGVTSIAFTGFASVIGALLAASNLSDLTSASTARTNLGLGALAVLATVGTAQIDADAVTFAKMQNIATARVIGRGTASSGDPEEMTLPSIFTCTAGAVGLTTQSANRVWAGPTSGSAAAPTFRALDVADLPRDVPWTTVVQASDESRTNNVLADGNTLQITGLVAGQTYEFMFELFFSSAATPGVKIALIDNDGVLTAPSVGQAFLSSGTNQTRQAQENMVSTAPQTSLGATASMYGRISGYMTIGVNGQLYFQWAQVTTNATAMKLLAGSFVRWRRVS